MNFKNTWKRANEGFTLVELIVVIAILAILAGVAVPAYSGYIKKANEAADNQVLSAVNTAFAAACLEEGIDFNAVTNARLASTANGDGLTISGIASVSGVNANVTDINNAFKTYLGSETVTTKAINNIQYVPGFGFKKNDGTLPQNYQNAYSYLTNNYGSQISNFQNSAFNAIGAEALLNQVNGVSGLATDMIAAESGFLFNYVMTEEYFSGLASKLGMDSADELEAYLAQEGMNPQQFLANSTVLTVADTMQNAATKDSITSMLSTGNFSVISNSLNNSEPDVALAQAAALYGMYTAYNPQGAANITDFDDLDTLMELKNDTGFTTYLSGLSDSSSQASKDLNGYLAALEMVNGAVNNDTEVATQVMSGNYNDANLVNLMNQVLAGNS